MGTTSTKANVTAWGRGRGRYDRKEGVSLRERKGSTTEAIAKDFRGSRDNTNILRRGSIFGSSCKL